MKTKLLIFSTALALCGCAYTDQRLRDGAYIQSRMQADRPAWVQAHGPLDQGEAVVRIYEDCRAGAKVSTAIDKECK